MNDKAGDYKLINDFFFVRVHGAHNELNENVDHIKKIFNAQRKKVCLSKIVSGALPPISNSKVINGQKLIDFIAIW